MQCTKCAMPLSENQKFCEECGTAVKAAVVEPLSCKCPDGTGSPDINGFCDHCGCKLVTGIQASRPLKLDIAPNLALMSDVGRHHAVNQDFGMVGKALSGAVMMVVADGVSSSFRAERASAMAVNTAYDIMAAADNESSGEDIIRHAIAAAHEAVMAMPHTNPRFEEPETTIVVVLLHDAKATIGWVGDSRAYAVNTQYARTLTRDDSWLAYAVESGIMTLEQAQTDPRAHSITQCVGMRDEPITIHVTTVSLEPDTWLLLCTDGLWNYFDQSKLMCQLVNDAGAEADAFELCQHLVKRANLAGGHDNITVAAYRTVTEAVASE